MAVSAFFKTIVLNANSPRLKVQMEFLNLFLLKYFRIKYLYFKIKISLYKIMGENIVLDGVQILHNEKIGCDRK